MSVYISFCEFPLLGDILISLSILLANVLFMYRTTIIKDMIITIDKARMPTKM